MDQTTTCRYCTTFRVLWLKLTSRTPEIGRSKASKLPSALPQGIYESQEGRNLYGSKMSRRFSAAFWHGAVTYLQEKQAHCKEFNEAMLFIFNHPYNIENGRGP